MLQSYFKRSDCKSNQYQPFGTTIRNTVAQISICSKTSTQSIKRYSAMQSERLKYLWSTRNSCLEHTVQHKAGVAQRSTIAGHTMTAATDRYRVIRWFRDWIQWELGSHECRLSSHTTLVGSHTTSYRSLMALHPCPDHDSYNTVVKMIDCRRYFILSECKIEQCF